MTLEEFNALEAKLGHAPTQQEVRAHKAKKLMYIKASHFVTFPN